MTGCYQVAVLGPSATQHGRRLERAVSQAVKNLGLASTTTLQFLSRNMLPRRDSKFPLVAVYFGGPSPRRAEQDAVQALVDEDTVVLPVVPTLQNFQSQVPDCLSPFNGLELDQADPELVRIADWVVESLGLVRERRFSFISYRRAEATRLALQLHQALDARAWRSFLDTHSVPIGKPFQKVLWDRMNDADLLILLDSPRALDSEWVRKELAQADQIGMGVLQVIWPGNYRDPCTAFAVPVYLDASSFRPGKLDRLGGLQLRRKALDQILLAAEVLRARSLAARRDRMVRAFTTRARAEGLSPLVQAADRIEVVGRHGAYAVTPVVGHVDSTVAFRAERRLTATLKPVLLYDEIGMLDDRVQHIEWLNLHPNVKSVATERVSAWARLA